MSWNRHDPDARKQIMADARYEYEGALQQYLQHYSFPGYPG